MVLVQFIRVILRVISVSSSKHSGNSKLHNSGDSTLLKDSTNVKDSKDSGEEKKKTKEEASKNNQENHGRKQEITKLSKPTPLSLDEEEDDDEGHAVLDDRIHLARRIHNDPNCKPLWITPEVIEEYHRNNIDIDKYWKCVVSESPALAEILIECDSSTDDLESLGRLVEQLYSGMFYVMLSLYRKRSE